MLSMSRNIWAHEDPNVDVTTALHSTTTTSVTLACGSTALRNRAAGATAEAGGVGLGGGLGAGGLGAGGLGAGGAGGGAGVGTEGN